MIPTVSSLGETVDGVLNFTLYGVNVSIANALRRILLSEVPTVVFRTFPHEENRAVIHTNTSRFNNEIIKQRLSCIPVHLGTRDEPIADYLMEVNVTNGTDSIMYVTTEDFMVKNETSGKYLSKDAVRAIFPPDATTGSYIDFVRLRPKISEDGVGESLQMSCKFDVGTAKQDAAFNVVSASSYAFTPDPTKAATAWSKKAKALSADGATAEEVASEKLNWSHLEAKRHFVENSFDFTVQSVGVFENKELVKLSSSIMVKKLQAFRVLVENSAVPIVEADSTMANSYDVTLVNEDYTLGKVLEYMLYSKHFIEAPTLSYCGFRKPHPHIDSCIIRVAFKDDGNGPATIQTYLNEACAEAIDVFVAIADYFK